MSCRSRLLRSLRLNSLLSCFSESKPSKFSTLANARPTTTTTTTTTVRAKKSFIFHLKHCNSICRLKQIHAQMFRLGLHEDPDALDKFMVFCADPSKGNLRYAETVLLSCIQYPSLLVYNLMIKAFTKSGSFRKSLFLFSKLLREDGLWPDNFTYPFVFKAIGHLGDSLMGENVHGFVVKTGLEFDACVCNSLMDMYARLGRFDTMSKVFDEMPVRDVVSWNVFISGCVKCRRFGDAISGFRRMQKESDLMPNEATVVATLSACAVTNNSELGKEIHRYVRDKLEFTSIIGNALVDMYCKSGCLTIAREVFDKMPCKNVICWTSMVSGYANCGELDEARELFERSPVRDVVLWTALINGYVQFNRFDEAVSLFREMQTGRVKPDKFVVVALLTGCAQMGTLEQGKWIHRYIEEDRIPVDTVIGTALIEMYGKCGWIEKAVEIFYGLREKDTAAWTSIICGLAMNGKTSEALQLFAEMRQAGARPDDITFIGVLSACSHGGLIEKGCESFNLMTTTYKIEPKLEHYGCLIDLLGRAGKLREAEELIRKVPDDNKFIVALYGSLLSACRVYGNVEMGERVAKQLVAIESSDSSVHTLLANIYASADRWEDVRKVRRKMKDLEVRKVPGCSSIEVDGIVHEFFVGGVSSHPEMREPYSMLDTMAKPMSGFEENEMEREDVVAQFR